MDDVRMKTPSRGIYLIANERSSDECQNLIYAIRECGCRLPVRVLPYGGKTLRLHSPFENVELVSIRDFPDEGIHFVEELQRRMPQCPSGLLRRFLAWFGEFDEFLYSDNDVVALMNWEELFPYLEEYEIVHADTEYLTAGKFNFNQPAQFEALLGSGSLDRAITAGHFLCRRSPHQTADLLNALSWMEANPSIPKWHDQALMHVALALSKWPALNLCKPPHNWACSWAGTYRNELDLFRTIQVARQPISHIHYSGGVGTGAKPMDDLLFSRLSARERNYRLLWALAREESGLAKFQTLVHRAKRKAGSLLKSER